MKIKIKLSLIMIIIVAVMVGGIAFILLRQASGISMKLSVRGISYLADEQAAYWKGREDVNIKLLRSLANIMSDY
jgi:hypothetical protein